jgi:hypothetical protein
MDRQARTYHVKSAILNFISWQPGQGIIPCQASLSPEIIHFSFMDATFPFAVPFALPTEGLGIVETLEKHFEIMNLEVDIPEEYVGPLTGMDFAKGPTADSLFAMWRGTFSAQVPRKQT